MKIIQIIQAPTGSFIVTGPWGKKPDVEYAVNPASVIALAEADDGERFLVPCGFDDDLDPEETHAKASLFANRHDAEGAACRWAANANK